jgi:hypothetical protein
MKTSKTLAVALSLLLAGCGMMKPSGPKRPRLCMFVGVDVSSSFLKSKNFDDAMNFMGHYLFDHINGYGGLDVPDALFVGSIGGLTKDEAKTFFPKQTFEGKSAAQITAKLHELFPKNRKPEMTDFSTFFDQVADTVQSKNLVLRPIVLILLSDGVPTLSAKGKPDYKSVKMEPLENLSRNVTVRLLYTDAVTGKKWQNDVPRRRVKVWTQDAAVMVSWKEPAIYIPGKDAADQLKFFAWLKDNVDFPVRAKRVD